jgi:hypothetical protein
VYVQATFFWNSADTIPVDGSGQVSGNKHRYFLDNRQTANPTTAMVAEKHVKDRILQKFSDKGAMFLR